MPVRARQLEPLLHALDRDRIQQKIAISTANLLRPDHPPFTECNADLLRQSAPKFDLESWRFRASAGIRHRIRMRAQTDLTAFANSLQRARFHARHPQCHSKPADRTGGYRPSV